MSEETLGILISTFAVKIYFLAAALSVVDFLIYEKITIENLKSFVADYLNIIVETLFFTLLSLQRFNTSWLPREPLFRFEIGYWSLFASFILYDLFFFLEHFLMHKISFLWAFHHVHHSSERFGLSVGFRLSWFRSLRRLYFFFPMVYFGFPPSIVIFSMALINLWGFFVHSASGLKFPKALSWIVSPHTHSLHHERKLKHSNYGGFLLIWDILFKTAQFESETNKVYGVFNYKMTLNPFSNQFNEFYKMYIKRFVDQLF